MTEFDGLDPASLAARIAALDEQGALDAVNARIAAGDDPLVIIEECQLGMRWVGEHYQSGKYFISGLIMAGEIFREAMVASVRCSRRRPRAPRRAPCSWPPCAATSTTSARTSSS